jgi:hypothetical protein
MRIAALALLVLLALPPRAADANPDLAFPAPSAAARPWAYWWWMASAVNEKDVTRELETFAKAGMGGVHVIPIYGAKGYEQQYVEYLSPRWLELLKHSVTESRRLGMDLDMTLGTGWCFGGPMITDRFANARFSVKQVAMKPGATPADKFDPAVVQAIVAVPDAGAAVELTDKIKPDGTLDWTAPADTKFWTLYALSQRPSGQKVKRPAPGGQGHMLNPFYADAIRAYVPRFEQAFAKYDGPLPRAVYHDSYEYQSNWSPDLFAQFEKRRGYRLQPHLPALLDDAADTDAVARVKHDYRETLSDLLVDTFMPPWVDWARGRKMLTRNEAHGSPGNLLDLYAAADVPETEMFNKDRDPLVAKFASSAAHVTGRTLVSAETGTWLAEHFTETLGDMKKLVDELFLSGVNHVFYHGSIYSPADAPWPGWLFYASTQMNSRNPIWRDAPPLNAYFTRVQSVLQSGRPDNDVLVYWPIHDLWQSPGGLVTPLTVHKTEWLTGQPVGRAAALLWQKGYAFDYVSDRQLRTAKPAGGGVEVGGRRYKAVVVPRCTHIPLETLSKLLDVAKGGATVVFEQQLPTDVPGLADLAARQTRLRAMTSGLTPGPLGQGRLLVGALAESLAVAGATRESLVDTGLRFTRRAWDKGHHYFLVNPTDRAIDARIGLARPAAAVLLMDPMTGTAGFGDLVDGAVRVQLHPRQSLVLRTFGEAAGLAGGPRWGYEGFNGTPVTLSGKWRVAFVEGGPALPSPYEADAVAPWTDNKDAEAFGGTARYTLTFDAPAGAAAEPSVRCLLDLGDVRDSARIRLNDRDLGTLLLPPFRVRVDRLRPTGNVLEVEVTSVAANRIRDLDRRGVKWQSFHDINFVNIDYKPFSAADWPVRPAGLIGPVRVTPEK